MHEPWAEARGEQDRINFARYVQHEEDSESGLEDFWEDNVAGDDNYGDPPSNPEAPVGPEYDETRQPSTPSSKTASAFEHA